MPSLEPVPEVCPSHPGLGEFQSARSVSTIPDAADVLALKAAIDNLGRQVAALEKRLTSGGVGMEDKQRSSRHL